MHDDRVHHAEGPKGKSVGPHVLFLHEAMAINRMLLASKGRTHLRFDLLPVLRRLQFDSNIGRPRRVR